MTVARLRLVSVLLVAAFGLVAAAAAVSLLALRDPFLAGVVTLAGLFGVAAGAATYAAARRDPEEAGLPVPEAEPELLAEDLSPAPPVVPRRPIRVQALPVANLPPAYLAAVMNGTRARTAAFKQQERQLH
ncbi:MAG TPA: hypothetical protein VHL79_05585 [Ramlibacter sp.]|jgi:hypothetical protein|nr:hypothetical protein [Ramlibacter sp.]